MLEMYADDTTILAKHKNNRYLHTYLQKHMHKPEGYFIKWLIKINPSKSPAVFFARKSPPHLYFDNEPINFEKEILVSTSVPRCLL